MGNAQCHRRYPLHGRGHASWLTVRTHSNRVERGLARREQSRCRPQNLQHRRETVASPDCQGFSGCLSEKGRLCFGLERLQDMTDSDESGRPFQSLGMLVRSHVWNGGWRASSVNSRISAGQLFGNSAKAQTSVVRVIDRCWIAAAADFGDRPT